MSALPSVAQVREIAPSLQRDLPPEFQDYNGHVNVSHHYALHMAACEADLDAMGLSIERIQREGVTLFSAEHRLMFLAEMHVGEQASGHVRWLGRSDKVAHGVIVLVNDATDRIASLCEFVELSVDLGTRRTAAFTPDVAAALDERIAAHEALGWSLPAAGPMGPRR